MESITQLLEDIDVGLSNIQYHITKMRETVTQLSNFILEIELMDDLASTPLDPSEIDSTEYAIKNMITSAELNNRRN